MTSREKGEERQATRRERAEARAHLLHQARVKDGILYALHSEVEETALRGETALRRELFCMPWQQANELVQVHLLQLTAPDVWQTSAVGHLPSWQPAAHGMRREGRTVSKSASCHDGFILLAGLGAIGWPASRSDVSLSRMSLAKDVLSRSWGSPSESDPSESPLPGGITSGNDASPADVVVGGGAGKWLLVAADETFACSDLWGGDIWGGVSGSCREELCGEGECDCAAVSAASMSSMAPVRSPIRMSSNPCSRRRVSSRSNALCNRFGSSPRVITASPHPPTRVRSPAVPSPISQVEMQCRRHGCRHWRSDGPQPPFIIVAATTASQMCALTVRHVWIELCVRTADGDVTRFTLLARRHASQRIHRCVVRLRLLVRRRLQVTQRRRVALRAPVVRLARGLNPRREHR